MTLAEIKKSLLEYMKSLFPADKYKYYSMAVVEDFDRPCFFTQLKPVETDPQNYNSRNNILTFYINYFQAEVDEMDMLEKIEQLRNTFGLAVKIGTRAVKVGNFGWDFVGTDRNVAEISFDIQWMDKIEHPITEDFITNIQTKIENGGK